MANQLFNRPQIFVETLAAGRRADWPLKCQAALAKEANEMSDRLRLAWQYIIFYRRGLFLN